LHAVTALYLRTFIIVDALDECQSDDGCRTRFLSEIFDLQEKYGASLFVTSRFIPEITKKFDGTASLEIRASDEDVRRYLTGHIPRLPFPSFVRRDLELQEEIKTDIITAGDGM
jgi:hypothetical protein